VSAVASVKAFLAELVGRPGELEQLRAALASLPPPPAPGRPVMDPDERRRLGQQLEREYERVVLEGGAAHSAAVDALWARIREAQGKLAELEASREVTRRAYVAARDGAMDALWAARPPELDTLVAELEAEAVGLRVDAIEVETPEREFVKLAAFGGSPKVIGEIVGHEGSGSLFEPRTFTNRASVDARRAGLRALAEQLREHATKGTGFATVDELRALHARGYKALPKVEDRSTLQARAASRSAA
jgi:hypothetical protein